MLALWGVTRPGNVGLVDRSIRLCPALRSIRRHPPAGHSSVDLENVSKVNAPCHWPHRSDILWRMKCPKCNVDLEPQIDRSVETQTCPKCQGMWLTPAELDQLENEAFNDEANKGSLFLVTRETVLNCPVCASPMKRFNYRFFDLELDFCPEHGFWLDKDKDDKIVALMSGEETRIEKKCASENAWSKRMNHLRSPSFFSKLKDLLHK